MSAAFEIVDVDLAQAEHCAALRTLLDAYARSPEGGGQGLPAEVLERLPAVLAESRCFTAWLAFSGSVPAGLANGFYGVSTFRAQPLLNIHDLFVAAPFRRRGVARALLAATEAAARSRGCCKLTLEVLEGNAAAIAAYRQAGFRPYTLDPAMGRAMFFDKLFN